MAYFDYSKFTTMVRNLGIAEETFHEWLEGFLLRQGLKVLEQTRQRQRTYTYINSKGKQKIGLIDTGYMINAWKVSDVETDGTNFYVEISNPAEYASYIEYGQRSFAGAYLVTVAVDDVMNAMPTRFERQFKEFLMEKGFGD